MYEAESGDIVQINGLVGHTHLNGRVGRVIGKRQDGGILVDLGKGEVVPVLPVNLADASGRSLSRSNSPQKMMSATAAAPPPPANPQGAAAPGAPGSSRALDAYEWRAYQSTGTIPPRTNSASPTSQYTQSEVGRRQLYGSLMETGLNAQGGAAAPVQQAPPVVVVPLQQPAMQQPAQTHVAVANPMPVGSLPPPPPNARTVAYTSPASEVYRSPTHPPVSPRAYPQPAPVHHQTQQVVQAHPTPALQTVAVVQPQVQAAPQATSRPALRHSYDDAITLRETELMVHLGRLAEDNQKLRVELEGAKRAPVSPHDAQVEAVNDAHNYHTAYNALQKQRGGIYNDIFDASRASFSPTRPTPQEEALVPVAGQVPPQMPSFLQLLERDFRRG